MRCGKVGSSDQPTFVFGIPTVRRRVDYLSEVVDALVAAIPPDERDRARIVIFNAEVPPAQHPAVAEIRRRYRPLIEEDFLRVLSDPDAVRLRPAHEPGQAARYEAWRAKLIRDCAFLMEACATLGTYYIHVEDDTICAPGFWPEFTGWFERHFAHRDDWFMLALFHPYDVPILHRTPTY